MDEGGIVTRPRASAPGSEFPFSSSPVALGVVAALPGLVLGVAGYFHPAHLNHTTAHSWWSLHVAGMFAFPLVGVALATLFRGRRDPVAVVAVLATFVYAVAYTALDVINGIGAGFVTSRLPALAPRPDEVRSLFAIGGPIGEVGSYALILAAVVIALDALARGGVQALPGLLLVPGAFLVHTHHIFWPLGAGGIALVGLGTGWLVAVRIQGEISFQ
jgi:hypothetical protein